MQALEGLIYDAQEQLGDIESALGNKADQGDGAAAIHGADADGPGDHGGDQPGGDGGKRKTRKSGRSWRRIS